MKMHPLVETFHTVEDSFSVASRKKALPNKWPIERYNLEGVGDQFMPVLLLQVVSISSVLLTEQSNSRNLSNYTNCLEGFAKMLTKYEYGYIASN